MPEVLYYIDDFTDEVAPCEPTLASWAAWLANPDPTDEAERQPPSIGEIFEASRLLVLGDVCATREADGSWTADPSVPEGTTALFLRWHEGGQGWNAEHSGETVADALRELDEDDTEAFLACVRDGGSRRLRYDLDGQGQPTLMDVTDVLEVA